MSDIKIYDYNGASNLVPLTGDVILCTQAFNGAPANSVHLCTNADGPLWKSFQNDGAATPPFNSFSTNFGSAPSYLRVDNFSSTFQSSFSISAWGKITDTSNLNFMLGMNVSGTSRYNLYTMGTTLYSFVESGDVNGKTLNSASSGVTPTDWFHVCVTFEQSGTDLIQKMYMNGSLAASGTTASIDLANYSTTQPLLIGARTTSAQYPWTGIIDELAFFNSALTETQVGSLIDTTGANPVPANLSSFINNGLAAWYRMGDHSSDNFVDGGSVASITDSSGNGNTATQTDVTKQPTFSTSIPA